MTTLTYPQAALRRDGNRWTADGGYTVTEDNAGFHVHTPNGHRSTVVHDFADVPLAVAALPATDGEYGLPCLAYTTPTASLY